MPTCTICKIPKNTDDFPLRSKSSGKIHSCCKECQKLKSKAHYENNKEKYITRVKAIKAELRDYLQDYKKNKQCSKCSETHSACLEFHHLDESTKYAAVSEYWAFSSISQLQSEIDKCVILCANCHRKIHYHDMNT